MEELRRIEIPLYIRRVRLSNARRTEYYEFGKKDVKAKKYLDRTKFEYRAHQVGTRKILYLTEIASGLRVVKNPMSAGTPKDKLINGQDIYNGTIIEQQRNMLLQAIKASFMPYVSNIKPIDISELPIRIEVELYDTIVESSSKQLWDVDNRFYMYGKAFQDVLTGNKLKGIARGRIIIPDDNNLIVSKPPSPLFIPVDTPEERKIIFRLLKEDDPRILNNELRKREFAKRYL